MRDILQLVGAIIGIIITTTMYVHTAKKFSGSKKTETDEKWLFEGFFRGSAAGVTVCLVFVIISLIF